MSHAQEFAPTELPALCLSCGRRGQFARTKSTFTYTTKTSSVITMLAPLFGILYYSEMVYTFQLPRCPDCSSNSQRAKFVAVAGWVLVFPVLFASFALGLNMDMPWLFALPVPYAAAAFIYYNVLLTRGRPKTALVNSDNLIIDVPGYGELALVERTPMAARRAQPRGDVSAQFNRAVCSQCGFINFASAVECKKCRAPVGASATI
jgi:hypothetical protein